MHEFAYHRATSLEDALERLGAAEDGALLAGGQTLIPTLRSRLAAPSDLVDISGLDSLRGVRPGEGAIEIGAMTTHAEIAADPDLRRRLPGLAALAGRIGDPAVRHRGTIGGSLANNDPAACYPAAVLALDATVVTDRREIAAGDFFLGLYTTDLDEDEIVTAVRFPDAARTAYAKFPQPASRFPMAGVFVAGADDGARVAVTGAGEDGVFRHPGLEEALSADWSAGAARAVEIAPEGLLTDIHGDAEYRAALIRAMAARAVEAAG